MPRLPAVLPSTELQLPRRSLVAAAAPWQALSQVGGEIASIGLEWAQKEKQLRIATEVTTKTSEAALKADQVYEDALLNPNIGGLETWVGFKVAEIGKETAKTIKDREARALFEQHYISLTQETVLNARHAQRVRSSDAAVAGLGTTMANYAILAVKASPTELIQIVGETKGAVDAAVAGGAITEERGGNGMRAWLDNTQKARYMAKTDADPDAALAELTANPPEVNPVLLQELINYAQSGVKQKLADRDRNDARAEKLMEEAKDASLRQIWVAVDQGAYTLQDLDRDIGLLKLDPQDHRPIRATITEEPWPSDQEALIRATLGVMGDDPAMTPVRLDSLYYPQKLLSRADYLLLREKLATKLRERGVGNFGFQDDEAKAAIKLALAGPTGYEKALDTSSMQRLSLAYEMYEELRPTHGAEAAKQMVVEKYLPGVAGAEQSRLQVRLDAFKGRYGTADKNQILLLETQGVLTHPACVVALKELKQIVDDQSELNARTTRFGVVVPDTTTAEIETKVKPKQKRSRTGFGRPRTGGGE